ncbi:GWT1-domain-containing protein [Meira miltonrushii]|uniref:GPI-anchored wall transfer protein 1 n=1 Tax=Meira miltonrushii TaxID=1280837 RepID=A0A316V689_9BASI|nr:GWT1-domain-containing protein [Meira miltonrushii]PWN33097.1 GWT1-domain-containing protein [Meira miltonrushii]
MTSYEDYKEAKEAFVSQLQGGSIFQINAVSITALTTYTLWAVLRNRGLTSHIESGKDSRKRKIDDNSSLLSERLQTWSIEFIVLVVPIVLACTVLAEHLILLNGGLAGLSVLILLLHPAKISTEAPNGTQPKSKHWSKESDDEEDEDEERERLSISADQEAKNHTSIVAEPFRVSIDSSAEAAAASAHPPTRFEAPGSSDASRSTTLTPPTTPARNKIVHRSSPSLARSAAPLPGEEHEFASERSATEAIKVGALVPRNQPFLTVYRSHMMLMTIICILAVDFKVFPREFAKCETWGTSLMDLGVGSFVFSLGIISAAPLLRSPSQRFKPMRLQLLRDARKSLPMILLGGIRVIMVKGVDYPEHVSEYGVHWNFFITLALLPFFGTVLRPFAKIARFSTIGLILSVLHQALLSMTSLGFWASSNNISRIGLIAQNKEGLTSLPGYLAIFLLGLDAGHYILPRDPYLAYRRLTASREKEKTDKLAMLLISYSVLWWGAYYLQSFATGGQVSRRLANLPYVLWVVAYNTSFLLAYVAIYMVLLQPLDENAMRQSSSAVKKGKSAIRNGDGGTYNGGSSSPTTEAGLAKTPSLFHALNAQAFTVFLLANLLTGLVNISIQTIFASNSFALFVLLLYLLTCLGIALLFQSQGWKLKI